MKKMLLLLVASMLLAWPLSAQWVFNGFESAVKDSMFSYATTAGAKKNIHINVDTATGVQGSKALKCTWTVHTTESWGGFNQLNFYVPRSKDNTYYANTHRNVYKDSTYMNFSGAKYVGIWFNNLVKSSKGPDLVHFRLELYEAGGGADYWNDQAQHEEWYSESNKMYDTTAGWKQLIIPLVDRGTGPTPNDQGFSNPNWSGIANNGTLDLDKIIGYSLVWTAGQLGGDSISSGVVMFDKLQLLDDKYEPIRTFNNFAQDTTDFTPYIGKNDAGSIAFFKETSDTLMPPSALGVDWKVNGAQTWGGYANFEYVMPAGTYFPSWGGNAYLQMYIKVVTPLTSSLGTIQNKLTMRLTLKETGTDSEEWYTKLNVIIDSTANDLGWQQVNMPLIALPGSWGQLSSKGFYAVATSGNGIIDFNQIGRIKFEFSMSTDAPEPHAADLFYSGKILIGNLTPAGFRNQDVTPPAKVTGVAATAGSFDNLITWTDVPGEPSSTYNVYFSEKAFSSVTEEGVENVPPFNLGLGTQLADHVLRAPVTDQSVTYYYGVTATDNAGNTNEPTVIAPITNTAKGVPTIAKAPPANITIDGNLAEWSSISPIVLNAFRSPKTAFVNPNGVLRDSNDLSVKAYLAVDAENLYVAFDVVDDTVTVDTTGDDYKQDCPDLFIGLYDWRGPKHGGYRTGATPEYQFRFSQNRLRDAHRSIIVMYPGANYVWKKKTLTSGYTVEAKIPFALLAQEFSGDKVFAPREGMRLPIDFEINDRDGLPVERDCELCYSNLNNDLSYQDMWRWTHTWIGAQWVTGVSDKDGATVNTYELSQNYPNPFNPATTIKYQLAKPGQTTLKVYDVLGREVLTLVNENQESGPHSVQFNGTTLASGIYIYRIHSGSFVDVKKMLFLK